MKKFLSLVLAIAMMLTVAVPAFAASFTDIEDSDYKVAIERLAALGVVNGRTETEYDPDGIVTRAEMAKLLVVCLGLKTGATILEETVTFADTEGHWAIGFINVASQYGLIKGDGDGNFRPDDTVNYAEAATMAIRALNYGRVVEKEGAWPTNYLNKALELKLFDDVEFTNADDGANRGSVAQLMWNMLQSPMWVVTQENEKDGIYYGKTGETMLKLKFPNYEVVEGEFVDWAVDIDEDEYVVSVTIGNDSYEYAKNDFYKFVPGTVVEALVYKDEDCISMYATEDNYLVEGMGKALNEKYENLEYNIGDYVYALLDSAKKTANEVDSTIVVYNDAEVVTEVEAKNATTRITTTIADSKEVYNLDNDAILEEGYLVIKDGQRATMADLAKDDVITWVSSDAEDKILLANGSIKSGEFEGLTYEEVIDDETYVIEVSGKKYGVYGDFYAYELDDEGEEVEIDDPNVLMEKEKDNDYLGKEVKLFLDEYDRLTKIVFAAVEESAKTEAFYLAVDGEMHVENDRNGEVYFAKLENKDGVESYAFEKDKEVELTAGSIYWVEFNTKGEIEEATLITEAEDGAFIAPEDVVVFGGEDDDEYAATIIEGAVDEDYGYIGEAEDAKVVSTTVVYSIVEILDEDDEPTGEYKLEIGKGREALDGLENFVVVTDADNTNIAAYVFAIGDSESTAKEVGIYEKFTNKNSVNKVTISGTTYELDDESVEAEVGDVVVYTVNEDEAKIVFAYAVSELAEAGHIVKVTDEFIYLDVNGDGKFTNDEDAESAIDLEKWMDTLKDNDYRVVVIDVDYNSDDEAIFSAVEEIEIADIEFSKDDCVAIKEAAGYLAIIRGYDM